MKNKETGNRVRGNRIPVARSGYPYILIAILTATGAAVSGWGVVAGFCLATALFIIYFFRDPDRPVPDEFGVIVSPADGRVVSVEAVQASPFFSGRCIRIGIFMSIFDVHVNRMPHEGLIRSIRYHEGSFMAADQDRASAENERNAILLETEDGKQISLVQVAGLIARRIVCAVRENEKVTRGERFGLIRFGSRVDLYLPESASLNVNAGDRVKAGSSVVGYLR